MAQNDGVYLMVRNHAILSSASEATSLMDVCSVYKTMLLHSFLRA